MNDRTKLDAPLNSEPVPFKHYLWLFNRQKVFLFEKVIESPVQLTFKELNDLYDGMHEDLADEAWPAKIGWIDWSTTPHDTEARRSPEIFRRDAAVALGLVDEGKT